MRLASRSSSSLKRNSTRARRNAVWRDQSGNARAAAGKNFVTANNSAYDTLDPHTVFDIGRIGSRLNMYDCLVRWVDNPPKLQMWLADKIDITPDGITYTVAMKQGATFHDGSPITADDVVFSMERILAMKQGAYGLFKGVVDPGERAARSGIGVNRGQLPVSLGPAGGSVEGEEWERAAQVERPG